MSIPLFLSAIMCFPSLLLISRLASFSLFLFLNIFLSIFFLFLLFCLLLFLISLFSFTSLSFSLFSTIVFSFSYRFFLFRFVSLFLSCSSSPFSLHKVFAILVFSSRFFSLFLSFLPIFFMSSFCLYLSPFFFPSL